jgi:DNA polymerase (family 10)
MPVRNKTGALHGAPHRQTAHLRKLTQVTGTFVKAGARGPFPHEQGFYNAFGLSFIPPELREGHTEVDDARNDATPVLVSLADIRGELHAHSLSSDGSNSIEQMAVAACERRYSDLGITDHSQTLKIARGVTVADMWEQIRFIDALNGRLPGIRVLKSAEVDILSDGSLDYPDALLRELDSTVCSIHSRFGLNKLGQTERLLRAMDNRHFHILGHATRRLLLKRPGYELDWERVVEHARTRNCFFEINSSPDRLDISSDMARVARAAGVRIAISTDAHSRREFALVRYGIDQARKAGLTQSDVLNCLEWGELAPLFHR